MKPLQKQNGISLVFVMVLGLVVGGAIVFISKMFDQTLRLKRGVQKRELAAQTFIDINYALENTESCTCNLPTPSISFLDSQTNVFSYSFNSISIVEFSGGICNMGSATPIATKTGVAPDTGIWIKSITLKSFARINSGEHSGILEIEYSNGGGGTSIMTKFLNLASTTSGSPAMVTINSCILKSSGVINKAAQITPVSTAMTCSLYRTPNAGTPAGGETYQCPSGYIRTGCWSSGSLGKLNVTNVSPNGCATRDGASFLTVQCCKIN